MTSLLRPLFVLLLALSVSACSNPFSPSDELEDARDKWEDQGIDSYRITVREICFCPSVSCLSDRLNFDHSGSLSG